SIGRIPFSRIEILDGDPAAQNFPQSENALFTPGNEVEILAGYRNQEDSIFKGVIVGQKIRLRKSGRGLLTVLCRHALYAATLTEKSATYLDGTDSDAISTALGSYSISLTAESTNVTHERLLQYQSTDWDFALARAQANGLFLIPTDDGAELSAPDFSQSPALELAMGSTIFELDLEFDARRQPVEFTATAWDQASQEILESTGSDPGYAPGTDIEASDQAAIHSQNFHISHPGTFTQEELDAFTSAHLLCARLTSHVGRVQCTGSPAPLPGGILSIAGVGAHFNGKHLISAVRHNLYEGQWVTDIQIGLNLSDISIPEKPKTMLPPISGLHLATVEALSDDPEGEFRVQISIPTLGENAAPTWARLASPTAGEARGMVYFPDIGDEVVVSFLNDDPRHAVILGSLHSSAHPSPIEPNDDNFQKGFISREELKMIFDDELKAISFETPNGNKLTLTDDEGAIIFTDENSNSITLNADGITFESAADLILNAPSGDVKISGTNVEITASAQLTASGSSGAEFSASGTTVVKGAMVQIN
ncbi:MAG: type VI secretion system tip protein VgrG, partial [Akkermansiaceae bacterium]|nr:type VI secretion system tip protein VgrG [Akkermansiaceae bacterium]